MFFPSKYSPGSTLNFGYLIGTCVINVNMIRLRNEMVFNRLNLYLFSGRYISKCEISQGNIQVYFLHCFYNGLILISKYILVIHIQKIHILVYSGVQQGGIYETDIIWNHNHYYKTFICGACITFHVASPSYMRGLLSSGKNYLLVSPILLYIKFHYEKQSNIHRIPI